MVQKTFISGVIFILCTMMPVLCADQTPIAFKADVVEFHEQSQTIQVRGNIHASQTKNSLQPTKTRHLFCQELIYNLQTKKIHAKGDVILVDPNGNVSAMDTAEITDDLQNGIAQALVLITSDQSRFISKEATRENGDYTAFKTALYSPCKLCRTPEEAPLWQLRASEVAHDKENQKMIFYNARLEMKGVPILYIPYLSHPDPSVRRKTGLLTPSFGSSKNLGVMTRTPYFYAIAPNRDMTITPLITTKEGPVMIGEYRHRFAHGESTFAGSVTESKTLKHKQSSVQPFNGPRNPGPNRWNIANTTRYDLSEHHSLYTDINRASDTTYLTRYPIQNQHMGFFQNTNLTSTVRMEQFYPKHYLGIEGMAFQTDAPKTTPIIHPASRFMYTTDPSDIGSTLQLDGNILALSRELGKESVYGTRMNRVSSGLTWRLPYITRRGHIVTTTLSSRFDGYESMHFFRTPNPATDRNIDRYSGRFYPTASVKCQYPHQKRLAQQTMWVIDPQVSVISSPYALNNKNLPNEDSRTFEFDDTSLFLANRFDGIDRVDSGSRAIGGVDQTLYFPQQRRVNFFFGQSRRLDNRQVVPLHMGETRTQSDYITRLKINPISGLTLRYRSAFHPDGMRPRYSELGTNIGGKALSADLGYLFLNKNASVNTKDISQLTSQIKSQFHEHWSVSFAQIHNLKKNRGGNLANFANLTYQDECFQFDVGVYKTGYNDRDIKPDAGFLFSVTFKNLGTFKPLNTTQYPGSILTKLS